MTNPYVWNAVDPDLCYGRDTLLHDLRSGLAESPRYSFGLAGGRRIGKTTLLRRVQRDLQSRLEEWREGGLLVILIYVDGLTLPRPLAERDLWELLFRELESVFPDSSHRLPHPDFDGFKSAVLSLFRDLEEQPRVVVMFDEVEPVIVCDWANAFLSHWRALLSNTPGLSEYFTAVFAGARELDALRRDIGSPLKDILEWRSLRCLTYGDACRLMQEPIEQQWDRPFLECVHRETGGHPMLLQYVMQRVCQQWPDALTRRSPEQLVQEAVERFARERGWQFGEWWARYCSPLAQRVYARLYDDGGVVPLCSLVQQFGLEQANDAVEVLQHVGLVAEEEDGLAFSCSGDMFRRWYDRYGTLTNAPVHDPEMYARLAEVEPDLAAKYLSAWRIFQAEMPNYSGAVGELRDLLTLLLHNIAPIECVQAEVGFQLVQGQSRPTRRQRVHYAARRRHSRDRSSEIASDVDLVETLSARIAQVAADVYGHTSGLTHTTATREQAYQALKQWESIFAQLLPYDDATE